jgi:hypothetical protein
VLISQLLLFIIGKQPAAVVVGAEGVPELAEVGLVRLLKSYGVTSHYSVPPSLVYSIDID